MLAIVWLLHTAPVSAFETHILFTNEQLPRHKIWIVEEQGAFRGELGVYYDGIKDKFFYSALIPLNRDLWVGYRVENAERGHIEGIVLDYAVGDNIHIIAVGLDTLAVGYKAGWLGVSYSHGLKNAPGALSASIWTGLFALEAEHIEGDWVLWAGFHLQFE